MLIGHVEEAGHPEHVPALREQMTLLLDALRDDPGLQPVDLERLQAIATDPVDPGDHSVRWTETTHQ